MHIQCPLGAFWIYIFLFKSLICYSDLVLEFKYKNKLERWELVTLANTSQVALAVMQLCVLTVWMSCVRPHK